METNLVVESIKFMFLGMGTVFLFLIIMIYFMGGMSNFVHRFFPEILVDTNSSVQSTQCIQGNQNDQVDQKKIVAAITAAIKHHIES
ncbi:MAG: OadG family transporter subunit [Sulfurimonas sp.]|nr:OadG family transporter subunit [Sulfurimonas sp.]